jgi:hypothetical protein
MSASPVPRRKPWRLIAVASVLVVAIVVIAFVLLRPGAVAVREEASPNPASSGQTVTFSYFLRNGLSSIVTVNRIQSVLYQNGSFLASTNITSSTPGWLTSTVQVGQEAKIYGDSLLVTRQFVGQWLERVTFFTSAGAFTSDTSYQFNP